MKTKYHVSGSTVSMFDEENVILLDRLPVDVYELVLTNVGLKLIKTVHPVCPSTLYGDVDSIVSRIMTSYEYKKSCMGVLFSGIKGAGKTVTCEYLAHKMLGNGYPIVYIKTPIDPTMLLHFIERLDTPVVFILDEFEKTYRKTFNNERDDRPTQNGFLTILNNDRIQHLFVLICNESISVNEYLLNRPGRIRYHFKYDSLSEDAIRQYCEDNLENHSYLSSILKLKDLIRNFTFDILKTIVEESNIYKEDPIDNVDLLNITRASSNAQYYYCAFDFASGFVSKGAKNMDPYSKRYQIETDCSNYDVANWDNFANQVIREYNLNDELAQIVKDFHYHNYKDAEFEVIEQKIGNSAFVPETTNFCADTNYSIFPEIHLQMFVGDIIYKNEQVVIYKSDRALVLLRTDSFHLKEGEMGIGAAYRHLM